MSFGFQIKDNTVWASISGEVDMQIASLWREALEQQLNSTLARNLTFDFTGVRFIDSSGLGVVLASRGGRVRIVGAGPQVYKILQLSGFAGLMEIEPPAGLEDQEAGRQAGGRM